MPIIVRPRLGRFYLTSRCDKDYLNSQKGCNYFGEYFYTQQFIIFFAFLKDNNKFNLNKQNSLIFLQITFYILQYFNRISRIV